MEMSRYNEIMADEALAEMENEQECKRCGDTYDTRHETFIEGLCTHCQYDEEIMLEEEK